MIRRIACSICAGVIPLVAQTQVDLKSQSKAVDFKQAAFTSPIKTGGALPSTCKQGDLYFLTVASQGTNLYGCSSDNNWVLETGGGGGSVQVQNGNTPVGARPILSLSAGVGMQLAISDTGQAIAIQTSVDTTLVETRGSAQSGISRLCSPLSGSGTAYTCTMSPTLTAYTSGMILHWRPDVDGAGGPTTLNVDSLGVVPVKLANGTTNPVSGDIIEGRMTEVWYDGAAFRILAAPAVSGILGETRPTCLAEVRGRLWYIAAGPSVADSLSLCAKDATDTYGWRVIY